MKRIVLVLLAAIALACAALPRWSVSADGNRIAVVKGRSIYILDREGKVLSTTRVGDKLADPLSAFITSDGKAVIYVCWGISERGRTRKALLLCDLQGGNTRELSSDTIYYVADGWSPDGTTFAWIEERRGDRGPLQLYDRKTDKVRTLHPELTGNPVWARDGSAIYAIQERPEEGKRRGRLVRVSMDGKAEIVGETAGPSWVQVGPQGELWLTTADAPKLRDIDISEIRLWRRKPGGAAFEKISDRPIVWGVLSPDGRHFAAAEVTASEGDGRIKSLLLFSGKGNLESVLQDFISTDNVEVPTLPFWLDAKTLLYAWRKNGKVEVYLLDADSGKTTDWTKVYEGLK